LRNDVYRSNSPADQVYFAQKVSRGDSSTQLTKIKDASLEYREVVMQEPFGVSAANGQPSVKYNIGINSIAIKSNSKADSVLFVAQTFRPQWKAVIAGKEPL